MLRRRSWTHLQRVMERRMRIDQLSVGLFIRPVFFCPVFTANNCVGCLVTIFVGRMPTQHVQWQCSGASRQSRLVTSQRHFQFCFTHSSGKTTVRSYKRLSAVPARVGTYCSARQCASRSAGLGDRVATPSSYACIFTHKKQRHGKLTGERCATPGRGAAYTTAPRLCTWHLCSCV